MYLEFRTRLFVALTIVCWNVCRTLSDQTVCSEYLLSGLYGVEDSALTASSIWAGNRIVCGPQNARLHFHGKGIIASSWCAGTSDDQQYIQVQLPSETVVDAILLQGRGEGIQQVETYYLQYSMDGITWTNVTSENQQPRHVVRHLIDCRCRPPLTLSSTLYLRNSQLHSQHACSTQCHKGDTCYSFTFDSNPKVCRGFTSVVTGHSAAFSTDPAHYFVITGNSFGFRPIPNEIPLYEVNERNLDQASASSLCIQHRSRLTRIDSQSKMSNLQNIIICNNILMQYHNQLFVSGMYVSPQWTYNDGTEVIDNALWSPNNSDPSQGHFVMLTLTGLASVDCTESLFSICEIV